MTLDPATRYAALAERPFHGRRRGGPTEASIGAIGQLREVLRHREVLDLLVRRDLKARYKDSVLGILWALARPLTQLAIYVLVIGHFLGAARGIPGFAIYVFTGLATYSLFSEIVSGATGSIIANAGLVKKVAVPREIYPLASVGGALFNFGIQLVVLILATLVLGAFPLSWNLLYAIPGILLAAIYGTALGLILAAWMVYLRDLGFLVEVGLMVLMWLSPILYSWSMVRDVALGVPGGAVLLEIYTDNPITLAVLAMQQAFWKDGWGVAEYPEHLLLRIGIALAVGLALLAVSHWGFRRLQGDFAQEL